MKLIIMRHGQASWSAPSDAERDLTGQGIREVTSTANALAKTFARQSIECICASPYRRAQQTAAVAGGVFVQLGMMSGFKVETLAQLIPEGDPFKVINTLPEAQVILVVSHMPLVGQLTELLCAEPTTVAFQTGMAVILEMEIVAPAMGRIIDTVMPG